jgi:hypothetical protein
MACRDIAAARGNSDVTLANMMDAGLGGSRLGGSRSARRRQKRRRTVVVAVAGACLALVAVAAGALVVTSGGDSDTAGTPKHDRVTSTSSTTSTSTTQPVATTAVPASPDPVVALAQQYDGRYVGTFANTTFTTTGAATLELRIDPATGELSTDAEFDGDLFGGDTKKVRRISGTVKLGDPNAPVTTQTDAFGAVTGRLDDALALVLTADDVPGAKVKSFTLTGRLRDDLTGFDATYAVTFEDGTTADGTITVTCDPNGARGSEVTTICALADTGATPPQS